MATVAASSALNGLADHVRFDAGLMWCWSRSRHWHLRGPYLNIVYNIGNLAVRSRPLNRDHRRSRAVLSFRPAGQTIPLAPVVHPRFDIQTTNSPGLPDHQGKNADQDQGVDFPESRKPEDTGKHNLTVLPLTHHPRNPHALCGENNQTNAGR